MLRTKIIPEVSELLFKVITPEGWVLFLEDVVNLGPKNLLRQKLPHQATINGHDLPVTIVPRKPYTVKLSNDDTQAPHYFVCPTDKDLKRLIRGEEENIEDKKKYSRHQSTTYAIVSGNLKIQSYIPEFFQSHRCDNKFVGVVFPLEGALIKRIFGSDMGTVNRPYDFDTEYEAQEYIKKTLKKQICKA